MIENRSLVPSNRKLALSLSPLALVALALWTPSAIGAGAMPGGAPAATPRGGVQELAEVLNRRAVAARDLDVDGIWAEAASIGDLVDADPEVDPGPAIDRLLESDPGERAVLLLTAVRLGGESPDFGLLMGALRPLLASGDQEMRRGAAELFADPGFAHADIDDLRDVIEELLNGAEDIDNEPATRLALATTAHAQGGGAVQRDARKVMLGFLESSSPELRGAGALALAEIGDLETARVELERLARQPGETGQLAESFLKSEELRGYYESRLRAQRKQLVDAQEKSAEVPEDLDAVEAMIALIRTRHIEGDIVARDELIEAALTGMLESLDQHSTYMNVELFDNFQQDLQGEYGGIGAYVAVDRTDNLFTITQPIYSGPAYRADLRSDDKIVQIDDWPTHDHGISKDQDEIIRRLKGKPGTSVKLYIWRRGMDPVLIERPTEDMAVEVERAQITIPTVKADLLPGGVGLVELSTFSGVASKEVRRKLEMLMEEGAQSIVLDLRANPGGLLSEARNVANLFLPKGVNVVTTESRLEGNEVLKTRRSPVVPEDMPVVVLVNRFSASASEIVSGALQDHGRATLVGQRTFGKGSVQNLISLGRDDKYLDENRNGNHDNWEPLVEDWNENGEFDYAPRAKLTIARYLLPSGRSIHRELDEDGNITSLGGVSPEFVVQPKRYEAWRLEAMYDLRGERTVREWVADRWEANKELFVQLAYTDGKDPERYPGFEELYAGLETPLSREDVRFLLRTELRRRAQDERGSAFPRGDFEEDLQLQKAIDVVLEERGVESDSIAEYRDTFTVGEDLTGREVATIGDTGSAGRRNLDEALSLIAEARQERRSLSQKQLDELQEILSRLDK